MQEAGESYVFKARRSDPADQWTELSVTYNLYDEDREGMEHNWPLSVTTVIPIRLDLKISVATQSLIKEGNHLGDIGIIGDISGAIAAGYGTYAAPGEPLPLNNDGGYTAYVELPTRATASCWIRWSTSGGKPA
jgi:hypothetical protein